MKEPLNEMQRLVVEAASDKKAFDILLLDLRNRSDFTDYFMICSGNSKMQVQAIADSILETIYQSNYKLSSTEGYSSGSWVVLDLANIIVHVFHKDVRFHYDLERLWGDVPIIKAINE